MSEYKKLDDWFPDGKPDGRKFEVKNSPFIVEPKFRSRDCVWYSLNQNNDGCSYGPSYLYKEYVPPKQTKKVKMYCAIYKKISGFISSACYTSDKSLFGANGDTIVGWHEIEVEVEE